MGNVKNIIEKLSITKADLMVLPSDIKRKALIAIANKIEANKDIIYAANKDDMEMARELVRNEEISISTYNRLKLDDNKMRDMIEGIRSVAEFPDPIGSIQFKRELDRELVLRKVTCPIGLIAVIFEARPDVITQISSLAIKTGNALILKGGKESKNTNLALYNLMMEALKSVSGFPDDAISLVFSHDDVEELLEMDTYVDLIIPRGSNELVDYIKANTKIPVLGHASGICNIYIDDAADLMKAVKICVDSKCQYPAACNSVENILVNKNFKFLSNVKKALLECDVDIIEDGKNLSIEFGSKTVNLVIVQNMYEALSIININGSGHTDCIVTENKRNADIFINHVDSAGVFHNCSTRFADGFRYGFGAEVGISTNKTHARGPVGMEGLTIYKYVLVGEGHIVSDYVEGKKFFKYRNLQNGI